MNVMIVSFRENEMLGIKLRKRFDISKERIKKRIPQSLADSSAEKVRSIEN